MSLTGVLVTHKLSTEHGRETSRYSVKHPEWDVMPA